MTRSGGLPRRQGTLEKPDPKPEPFVKGRPTIAFATSPELSVESLSSAVYRPPSIVRRLSSVVYRLSSIVRRLSSIVRRLSSIVRRLSSVVHHKSASSPI